MYLESQTELAARVEALTRELASLRRQAYLADVHARENERLRALLGRTEREQGLIPTSVIHTRTASPYGSIAIDAGADIGVREGMLVTTAEGIALGVVTNAHARVAVVTLFSAYGMQTDVVLAGTSTQHAILSGIGAETMLVELPRDVAVHVGDPMLLPAFSAYPVGFVVEVVVDPEDAFQTLYIAAPESAYMVRYALVDTMHSWHAPHSTTSTEILPPTP